MIFAVASTSGYKTLIAPLQNLDAAMVEFYSLTSLLTCGTRGCLRGKPGD